MGQDYGHPPTIIHNKLLIDLVMIIIEFNKENQIPTTVIGRMRKSLDAIKKITREEKKTKN
jgi:hypothetical protein